MKKFVVICLLAFILPAIRLSAQQKDSVTQLPPVTVTTTSGVSEKIDKSFKSTFPDAQNLTWYKMDKDYLAKFMHDDMSHNTLYKKNGYLKYDIAYGSEKNLPEDVRKQVQDAYSDYKIINAINVKEEGRNIWVVNLEGMKSYVTVRVEDGDLEEVKKLTKAG